MRCAILFLTLLTCFAVASNVHHQKSPRTILGAHFDYSNEVAPLAALITTSSPQSSIIRGITTRFSSDDSAEAKNNNSYEATRDVEVTVKGTSSGDVLGLFCVPGSGEWVGAAALLLDFVPLNDTQRVGGVNVIALLNTSVAIVSVRLPHARCNLTWRVIDERGDLSEPTIQSNVFNSTEPYHARIAYGPSAQTEMWVSWTTDTNSTDPYFMRIGTSSGSYDMVFYGDGPLKSYAARDMCGAGANQTNVAKYLPPGYFAHVLATGLAPGTRYYAIFGSISGGFARETTFVTAKAQGSDIPVRLAVFGDMALSLWDGAMGVIEEIIRLHDAAPISTVDAGLDACLHFGDLGYAEGSTIVWDLWHSYIESATRKIPYAVSQGNHEVDHATQPCFQDPVGPDSVGTDGTGFHPHSDWGDDSDGEGGVATWARFKSPGVGVPGGTVAHGNSIYWYSFDIGSMHVIMMDSEHNMTSGSAQFQWLAADLTNINHTLTPHVIVTTHRPLFTPEAGDVNDVAELMRADLEPLFIAHGVTVVLGGHIHAYERVCALLGPATEYICAAEPPTEGITYITVGSAGATVHNETMVPDYQKILKGWRVEWGFGIITAVNKSALRWDFWSIQESKIVDTAWLRA